MKTYQLIKLSPLKVQYSSVNGLPSSLTRDAAAPPTPDGYDYVENLPMPDDAPEGQYYVRDLTVDSYGWKLEDVQEEVIDSVTRIQMRDVLIEQGLFDSIESIIAGMPETSDEEVIEKKKMNDWWNHAPNFRRENARVAIMQAALGLTDEEVDAIFLAASLVE
jgi:hypothetical protein